MASDHFSGSSKLRDGSPGGGDLLLRGGGEGVRADPPRRPGVTVAQHLDLLAGAHGPLGGQVLRGDVAAVRVELGEPPGIDDLVGGLEPRVGEALQLRHPAVQRHLAALEGRRHLAAGLGALGAPAGRLALGRLAAAHPGPRRVRTRGRAEVMQLQPGPAADGTAAPGSLASGGFAATGPAGASGFLVASSLAAGLATTGPVAAVLARACHAQSTSSTVTRWRTAWIMPRDSGRSALMTTSPIRFSPSERSEARCWAVPPIRDLVWVIFNCAIEALPVSCCPMCRRRRRPRGRAASPRAPRPRSAGLAGPRSPPGG